MRVKLLVGLAALVAVALPAQAKAGSFVGVVVAKQSQHGTLVLAGARGTGMTVLSRAGVRLGDRVRVVGTSSRGDLKASKVTKLGHVTSTKIRGTVVRKLARALLLSTGHSVIRIRTAAARRLSSANDHGGGMQPGDKVEVDVDIDEDDIVQNGAPVSMGQASTVDIEGEVVTTSPFVVSIEGLPVTITVPAGMTLPTGLAAGDDVELTVQVGTGNVFTLVSIEDQNDQGDDDGGDD
jgi:hypothetical protein